MGYDLLGHDNNHVISDHDDIHDNNNDNGQETIMLVTLIKITVTRVIVTMLICIC